MYYHIYDLSKNKRTQLALREGLLISRYLLAHNTAQWMQNKNQIRRFVASLVRLPDASRSGQLRIVGRAIGDETLWP